MKRFALKAILVASGVTAVIGAGLAAVIVASTAGVAAGQGADRDGGGNYRFAAIFDNAGSLIPGQQVKVAGIIVGRVDKMSLTGDRRHALVEMTVTRPGIGPFRQDAQCFIRPQSLIGERFVECEPGTAGRPVLSAQEGKLPLLTLDHTHSMIDPDLVNNIMRLPYRDRFRLILNEFGIGLAGNGEALNQAIRRANPALYQTNRVLEILAEQNQVLGDLVEDSDQVFQPLAAKRAQVADFIVQANRVQRAVAQRRGDLERSFERLPATLRQLRPMLKDLGALSDEMTPVMVDLNRAAPDLSRALVELGPFSRAANPAFESLGDVADVGRPALAAFEPVAQKLKTLAASTAPFSETLAVLLQDMNETGFFEQFVTAVFNTSATFNAFDSYGHVARARALGTLCVEYEPTQPAAGVTTTCAGHIDKTGPKEEGGGGGESSAKLSSRASRARRSGETSSAKRSGHGSPDAAGNAALDYLLKP